MDYQVSVVIPAYNVEKYIARAIESVLTQTYPVYEIIVIDDGSTDNTSEVIKHYNSKVNCISQKNAGIGAARNSGIMASRGTWIAFLDADDEWLPEKQELQIGLLKRNNNLNWTSCNYFLGTAEKKNRVIMDPQKCNEMLIGKEYLSNYFDAVLKFLKWNPTSILIKRQAIIEAGMFCENLRYFEDIDMWIRVACKWPNIGFVNQPLAIWYYDSIGSTTSERSIESKFKWLFVFLDRLIKLYADNEQNKSLYKFITRTLHRYMIETYINGHYDMTQKIIDNFSSFIPSKIIIIIIKILIIINIHIVNFLNRMAK